MFNLFYKCISINFFVCNSTTRVAKQEKSNFIVNSNYLSLLIKSTFNKILLDFFFLVLKYFKYLKNVYLSEALLFLQN